METRMNATVEPNHESSMLTVSEAALDLRISRNLAYELVSQGRLPHIRLGRRVLIPRHSLDEWIVREAGKSESKVISLLPR